MSIRAREGVGVLKRSLEAREQLVDLRLADDQGRAQGDGIEDVANDQAVVVAELEETEPDRALLLKLRLALLVSDELDGSNQTDAADLAHQRVVREALQAGQQAPETKPVLEVNAEHALVKKLDGSVHFHDLAHILFDQALLAEGGLPEDPAAYVKRVNALLV